MFEDIYEDSNKSNSKKKHKQLQKLLSKYVELKKFQEINEDDSLTVDQKRRINKSKNKKKILRKIHTELSKRFKPEETYEVWHLSNNLNVNLDRLKDKDNKDSNVDKLSAEDIIKDLNIEEQEADQIDGDDDEDDNDDETDSYIEHQLNKFTNSFDGSSSWTKANFLIRTKGLEVLPIETYEHNPSSKINIMRQHINNLKTLLHLNVLRGNWTLAYKIFCLLIRIPNVDIRSIWSIGVEILSRQNEELAEDPNKVKMFKDEKFFEWLSSFFIINGNSVNYSTKQSRKISAPIWRSGSKTHTPLYIITSLWNLMTRNEYSKLKDKLEELLLEPPYNTDGVFYFLMALCKLSDCINLTNKYNNFDDYLGNVVNSEPNDNFFGSKMEIYNSILDSLKEIEKNLDKCKELNFQYPKTSMNNEIISIMKSIGHDYNDNSDYGSNNSSNGEEEITDELKSLTAPIEVGFHDLEQNDDEEDDEIKPIYDDIKNNDFEEFDKSNEIFHGNLSESQREMDFDFDFD